MLNVTKMGRATEFFHFINKEKLDSEDSLLYTHLTITEDIKKLRQKYRLEKKSGLKLKGGTFELF